MNSQVLDSPRRRRPLLTVIDRMVALDLAKAVISVLLVLVVIIVSRKFLNILTKAIEGDVAGGTLLRLLGLKIVSATALLLPPAMFMALLIVLGRMYRDQEMSILACGGVGTARLYRAVGWTVVPVCLLSGWLALEAMPWSERTAQELMRKDEQTADIRGIKGGQFNEFSAGDVILYAEELTPDNIMHKIFVQSRQEDQTAIVIADHGHLQRNELGEHFVVLSDGRRYQGLAGRNDFVITEFSEYAVRVDSVDDESAQLKREAEDSVTLWRSRTPRELAELQKRFAVPSGILCLTLLAVPLARIAPRAGVYGNVFTAFLIYVVYENAQKVAQGMLMTEKIPMWLSYSGIYGVMLLLTGFLLVRNLGFVWLLEVVKRGIRR